MRNQSSNRAILVLESPWELDSGDANRSSVLPFIEGVAKLAGDTEVYHANFYDKKSFIFALNCLCKTQFKNTIVYIAAHGYKQKIGNMKISDLLFEIGRKSKEYNITGIMLGSCFVGENTTTMEAYIEQTNIKWCAGYSSTSMWLEGTMIDCAILAKMSTLDNRDFSKEHLLINRLAEALSPFSSTYQIGDDYDEDPINLKNSMNFVIQPAGQGKHAKTVSKAVFDAHKDFQLEN